MKSADQGFTERIVRWSTGASASLILFISAGICLTLLWESFPAFRHFGVWNFLTSTNWDPSHGIFGAGTSLIGTVLTTFIALIFATPVAVGIAIFVTEIAPNSLKPLIGLAIELLAAIPSIIYGMWGLYTLSPILADKVEPALQKIPGLSFLFTGTPIGIDIFTASIILSIMVIPFTASIARDSFLLTPGVVKESSYALGATKWEVISDIVLPYSKTGVWAGITLSLGRALGETMAVAFVLGNKHHIPSSLLDPADSITVTLANEFAEANGDLYVSSLFALATILFFLSFGILAFAKRVLLRKSKERK